MQLSRDDSEVVLASREPQYALLFIAALTH